MSAQTDIAQADALVASDLSDAHVEVQSLARTFQSRRKDQQAHVFARALVRRARSAGVEIPSGSGGGRVTKADLEAEAERRGLEVEGTGSGGKVTVADLEAALKADDEA